MFVRYSLTKRRHNDAQVAHALKSEKCVQSFRLKIKSYLVVAGRHTLLFLCGAVTIRYSNLQKKDEARFC